LDAGRRRNHLIYGCVLGELFSSELVGRVATTFTL